MSMAHDRFAFCIIAHNEPKVFKTLVAQIDNPDNDIFVMIDKKADISLFNNVETKYSKILFCPNRVNIRWGELSLVKAELEVFSLAMNNGKYLYYHLLSGQDLLIKPVEQLNDFMRTNKGKEFIGLRENESGYDSTDFRLRYFHLLPHLCRSKYKFIQYLYFAPLKLQKMLHLRRREKPNFVMGSNWCSLTDECVNFILNSRDLIKRVFKFSVCIDEMYKQFIITNSSFKANIYPIRNARFATNYLQLIDWARGQPYTWQDADYDELSNSSAYIARKFSSKNINLINRIFNNTNTK